MNYIITDLKKYYKNLDNKRRVQVIITFALAIIAIASSIYLVIISNNRSGSDTILRSQNEQLQKNNVELIRTVQQLNLTVIDAAAKDSVQINLIRQNSSLLPIINDKISNLNKGYEKVSSISNYSNDDLAKYIASEADRIRREGLPKP